MPTARTLRDFWSIERLKPAAVAIYPDREPLHLHRASGD